MPTNYPAIRPTTRQFVPPILPVSNVYTMNNRISKSLLASEPGKAELVLTYENIPDEQAQDFIEAYNSTYGSYQSFELPTEYLSGLEDDLKNYVSVADSALTWRWNGPPKIDSVIKGISTVSVTLKASTETVGLLRPDPAPSNPYVPEVDLDTTRYPSFSGSVITPPPPPNPVQGKKWISYNSYYAGDSKHASPVVDSAGNIYQVRNYDRKLSLTKFNPSGSVLWRRVVAPELGTGYTGEFVWQGSVFGYDTGLQLYCINDDYILVYADLTSGGGASPETGFALLAFTGVGNIRFIKRYARPGVFGGSIRKIVYNPSTNKLIAIAFGIITLSVSVGIPILEFSASSGLMTKYVQYRPLLTTIVSSSLYQVYDALVKSNGNLVLFIGYGQSLFAEIDSGLSTVVQSVTIDNLTITNATLRPDTGGYLCYTTSDYFFALDDSFQLISKRQGISATGSGSGWQCRFYYVSNDTFLLVGSGNLFRTPAFTGLNIAKVHWDANSVEWITTVTDGLYRLSPDQQKIYVSPLSSNYTWLSKSDIQVPATIGSITTPTPPTATFQSVTNYNPNASFQTISNTVLRTLFPASITSMTTYSELSFLYSTYNESIYYDNITDV